MTVRERQILALLRRDPMISQQAIAGKLGISRSAVAGHIMHLTDKGIIKGRGYVLSETPFAVAIGGANVDIHGAPNAELRTNDSNPGTVRTSPGGVARNVAENLARLGADCRLITAVGNDSHGELLLQHGRDAGIDMRHVARLDSPGTSTYLSVLDDSGDMHVAVSDMSIADRLDADRLRPHETMLKQAAVIVIDTNLPDDALAYLTDRFAGHALLADTVSTAKAVRIKPYLSAIHTLKPSLIEAESLAGMKARTDRQLSALAKWFHDNGVLQLFITLGGRGVFYSAAGTQGIETSNTDRRVANAGGAGDAFLAGLAYAKLEQWPLVKSLRFALAAANVTLSHDGTGNPALSLATVNREYRNCYVQ